jgi:hypothetical protein
MGKVSKVWRVAVADMYTSPRYIARIKDVAALRLELPPLIDTLSKFFVEWTTKATSSRLHCNDATATTISRDSDLFLEHLGKLIEKICKIANREQKKYNTNDTSTITAALEGLSFSNPALHRLFEGPGKGRHDNDFASIEDIRIAPTHQELTAEKVRYSLTSSICIFD